MFNSRKLALTAALAIGRRSRQLRRRERGQRVGVELGLDRPVRGRAVATSLAVPGVPPSGTPSGQPWGQQRSDETLLTGDTKAKVEAVATAKLPGATIVRTETDADGNAKYEVHMVQADGTPATVYVDKSFNFVSVETGMPGGHGGRGRAAGRVGLSGAQHDECDRERDDRGGEGA